MKVTVERPAALEGEITLPGDKSISHRALILNSIATGEAFLSNLSAGADVDSTVECLRALGVEIEAGRVHGAGLHGLRPPSAPLDCGNSGTTMRLLAGLLAAQPFETELTGDASLSRRPMDRVVEPLRRMGAKAATSPLRVGGRPELIGVEHVLPVASAQVKSALLLAGLYASGVTTVREPVATRNHTELMLAEMGAPIQPDARSVSVAQARDLRAVDVRVPGDVSAAAFWLVAGALHPRADLLLSGVGTNPTRTAVLDVLRGCGLQTLVERRWLAGSEPVSDLRAGTARGGTAGIQVIADSAAELIDELPVLAVAATQLDGSSVIAGAGELRIKESDRIAAMVCGLSAMGAAVTELTDGFRIEGPVRLHGAAVISHGDHRVAMALAVAGMLADGRTEIDGAECVDVSYPGFWRQLDVFGAVA